MSTPQDPHHPGEAPRDAGETPHHHNEPPQSRTGPTPQQGEPPVDRNPDADAPRPGEQASDGPAPEAPDEPFVTPAAPQPPDRTQSPRYSSYPPDETGAATGAPQPAEQSGEEFRSAAEPDTGAGRGGGETPRSPEDPPTEYLPKILHRESGAGSGRAGAESEPESHGVSSPADDHPTQMLPTQPGQPGEPGAEAPRMDKGTAAYTHGWRPGSDQPGHQPMGEVPPQAWSARPEEQTPGQAWQPQSPEQPGYSRTGGTPYPPPGAYGGRAEQAGDQSGWGRPPGEQQGWNADQPGQSGWTGDQAGQQDWNSGQQGWSGGPSGQPGWGSGRPGQQGWGSGPSGQPGWGSDQPGQTGWGGGGQPGEYPAYPQQQYQPYGVTQPPERSGPQVLSIIGFVCAAVSLLFCPLLFGIAGIALGVIGHIRGESLGKWAAIAAVVCLIIGIVLALALSGMDMVPIESAG